MESNNLKSSFTEKVNKAFSSKIWYYIENILVVGLLFYCIKSLTDYDNVYYQTWKNEAAAKAILAFTAIVFIIRKVKLLNWQSLVATLLFGAVVFERMHYWADAEDILAVIKPQMATEWLTLMIIIDMILYKNVNNLFKGVNYLLILYVLMTFGMIWRRHDRMDPIVLVFPMFLFALVKMDEEKTEWFMRRFIDAWFISFIYVVVRSFKERPYEGFRYYGYFLNIGPFGIFMICCLTVAIFAFIYTKNKYKIWNISCSFCLVWILSIIYMLWIIDTRTILVGVFFCLSTLFLFVRKKTTTRILLFRFMVLGFIVAIIVVGCIFLIKICMNVSDEWLSQNFAGNLSPIVHYIIKFKAMGKTDASLPLKQQLFSIVDIFSSGRLSIIKEYSAFFNFDGNGPIGLEIENFNNYWAYDAHNTYVQFLVEYGYMSLFELLTIIILSVISIAKAWLLNKKAIYRLLPLLWISSMLGVWIGEASTFFYPITFFGIMFIARLLPQE